METVCTISFKSHIQYMTIFRLGFRMLFYSFLFADEAGLEMWCVCWLVGWESYKSCCSLPPIDLLSPIWLLGLQKSFIYPSISGFRWFSVPLWTSCVVSLHLHFNLLHRRLRLQDTSDALHTCSEWPYTKARQNVLSTKSETSEREAETLLIFTTSHYS